MGMSKWNICTTDKTDGTYSRELEKERERKRRRQKKCVHPDEKVSIICRCCLAHLEDKGGYVARKREDVV
jgi:hypothetical protein